MTRKAEYLALGFKLMPSGQPNDYIWAKHTGRLGHRSDPTWIRDPANNLKGHHTCCASKRDYYHKVSCEYASRLSSDDLSDLKDL